MPPSKSPIRQSLTTTKERKIMAIGRLSVCTGAKGKASAHAQYIAREGKYEKDPEIEKLEHTESGNMPKWAESDPNFFWQMADEYERKNGSTYREHVITLPRELNEAQRLALVQDWIEQEIGDKFAYQFAIHTPKAMDGKEQPHCHLMFSERTIDGIERDPAQYFKRYNSKNPERGGAKKANTGIPPADRRADLSAQRERWEQTCNKHLELANSDARISMKSLKAQGIEREPVNFSMIEINKPSIRQTYMDHLNATTAFKQAKIDSLTINIIDELSAIKISEKHSEQAATAANGASDAINGSIRAIEDSQYLIDLRVPSNAWADKKTQLFSRVLDDSKQRIDGSKQLAADADQAITRADQAINKRLAQQSLSVIVERTPFDLLGIQMRSIVRRSDFGRVETSLSGDIAIGGIIGRIITAANNGYNVDLREGNNEHLAGNKTAQGIKGFMLKNLSSSSVRYDYSNLSIEKFTDKYELRCDLNDLQKLNEINPPEPVAAPKSTNHQPSAATIEPQSTNNYDFYL